MACEHYQHENRMCPECELDYLDACIARDMARIEVLKQIIKSMKAKGEQNELVGKR